MLVTGKTDPDWEPTMKCAAAIVTNRGGRTCHAAIVSRELGVPAIVGTEHGTGVLKTGQLVTVSCAEGDVGVVCDGTLAFSIDRVELSGLGRPQTAVMMNVGNPAEAFGLSFIPNDGVGLARTELIFASYIKVHPRALLDYAELDVSTKAEVDAITQGYDDKPQFLVDKLAEGVAMIAAAFYPKPVIVRMSDFKSRRTSTAQPSTMRSSDTAQVARPSLIASPGRRSSGVTFGSQLGSGFDDDDERRYWNARCTTGHHARQDPVPH